MPLNSPLSLLSLLHPSKSSPSLSFSLSLFFYYFSARLPYYVSVSLRLSVCLSLSLPLSFILSPLSFFLSFHHSFSACPSYYALFPSLSFTLSLFHFVSLSLSLNLCLSFASFLISILFYSLFALSFSLSLYLSIYLSQSFFFLFAPFLLFISPFSFSSFLPLVWWFLSLSLCLNLSCAHSCLSFFHFQFLASLFVDLSLTPLFLPIYPCLFISNSPLSTHSF